MLGSSTCQKQPLLDRTTAKRPPIQVYLALLGIQGHTKTDESIIRNTMWNICCQTNYRGRVLSCMLAYLLHWTMEQCIASNQSYNLQRKTIHLLVKHLVLNSWKREPLWINDSFWIISCDYYSKQVKLSYRIPIERTFHCWSGVKSV